jgi:hypothetical protein
MLGSVPVMTKYRAQDVAPLRIALLETEPSLELDHAAGKTVGRTAETTGVLDIRRGRCGNQGR